MLVSSSVSVKFWLAAKKLLSGNISRIMFCSKKYFLWSMHYITTTGSERKFVNSVMKIPSNLDVELGTDRGKVLKSEIDLT